MLVGRLPFVASAGGLTRRDLAAIAAARYEVPAALGLSGESRDLLSRLLVSTPQRRLRSAAGSPPLEHVDLACCHAVSIA